MGDPAGIGGELTIQAWHLLRNGPPFLAIDDPERLRHVASELHIDAPIVEIADPECTAAAFRSALPVLPVRLAAAPRAGRPDPLNAPAVVASIEHATRLAMAGAVGGVVTNPINKAALYGAGFAYPGHTEFLAALTQATGRQIMMLASPDLRVVPVTVHASLRDSVAMLSTAMILSAARTTASAMRRDFGITQPRLAMAGLNPHAGEQGALGEEEVTIIDPAIAALRADGIEVSGPWPPDTMFTPAARARYDVAICMYHDQGLIPLKTLDMNHGVNVTLGLPIVRTSPDHGTAYDIAGQGRADPSSLIELAGQVAARRQLETSSQPREA
jgi:4-hydroxythreonine-4-phosphate dehydrogenase